MKLSFDDIPQSPKPIRFSEKVEDLNEIYREGQIRDFEFPAFLEVELVYYRSGEDIFFQGSFGGMFEAHCSRCLKRYSFPLEKNFEFVLVPDSLQLEKKAGAISPEELGLSYYSTEEINLTPLIREQVLLALPTRPLCEENCRGLCGGCGANLNDEACVCTAAAGDPRMAIFQTLKIGR
ncbi:MAG TPA: DUF177 domain-containing protein [Candidatus Binatia bacterium]|nr:DUF177 domain-containing protein [Candidatus Binatia bacterium]